MAARRLLPGMCAALAGAALATPVFAAGTYRNIDIDYVGRVFTEPYFKTQPPQVAKSVHVVAILPVDLGVAGELVPHPQEAAERIEKLAADRLAKAGIQVIPAAAMRDLMNEARASIGDLYDTHTGQPRTDRIFARSKFLWDEERKRHPADAYLMISLVSREAQVSRSTARWDGIEDSASGHGELADTVANFLIGPAQQFAGIPAFSLAVWLLDSEKNTQYASAGGLHLGAYIRRTGSFPEYVPIAPSDAVVGESRIQRALDVALDPALPRTVKQERRASFPEAPAFGGPAPGAPPFLTAAQFRAKYHKIALKPVGLPQFPRQAEIRARYESIIRKQLEAAGFEVIGSDAFMHVWMGIYKSEDDLVDGQTGRRNKGRLAALHAQADQMLREQTQCDALLSAQVFGRPALFLRAEAHWLGASQVVSGDSTALEAKLAGVAGKVGSLSATALSITVVDTTEVVLYEGAGGIELRAHLTPTGFAAVPDDKLFADPQRDETAVHLALADLLTAKSPN